MRRVGEEPAQALLASGAIREGVLDLGEHLVKRGSQATDLGSVVGGGYPLGEIAVRDLARHAPDPL